MSVTVTHLRLLRCGWSLPCLGIALLIGCGGDSHPVATKEAAAVSEPRLVEVPAIHFDEMAPISADQLREARRFLTDPSDNHSAADYGTLGMLCHGFDLKDAAQVCYDNAMLLDAKDHHWPYLKAQLDREEGQVERAIDNLSNAIALMTDAVPTVQRVAAHCWLGRLEQEAGQLSEAQTRYQAALALDPSCTYAHFGLARVAVAEDRFEVAERHLNTASQLQPDTGAIQHLMGTVLRRLGRTAAAAGLLRAAAANHNNIELNDPLMTAMLALPISSRKHQNRGNEFFEQGRFDEAMAEFSNALEIAPTDALSHCNRGAALQKIDRLAEAEDEFRAALRIGGSDAQRRAVQYRQCTVQRRTFR